MSILKHPSGCFKFTAALLRSAAELRRALLRAVMQNPYFYLSSLVFKVLALRSLGEAVVDTVEKNLNTLENELMTMYSYVKELENNQYSVGDAEIDDTHAKT